MRLEQRSMEVGWVYGCVTGCLEGGAAIVATIQILIPLPLGLSGGTL